MLKEGEEKGGVSPRFGYGGVENSLQLGHSFMPALLVGKILIGFSHE